MQHNFLNVSCAPTIQHSALNRLAGTVSGTRANMAEAMDDHQADNEEMAEDPDGSGAEGEIYEVEKIVGMCQTKVIIFTPIEVHEIVE